VSEQRVAVVVERAAAVVVGPVAAVVAAGVIDRRVERSKIEVSSCSFVGLKIWKWREAICGERS
jgi:hypothetical protein